ncbi:MAG: DNA polymerase III subunit chi [Holosporales bacterium]|jgi:DNA polymerase-3 subunit chi|nr:DNA polymerase III subunit chi [Holosporales bacterium]
MEEIAYEAASGKLDRVLAKLLEKAFASEKRTVVHSPISERLSALDDYLWTYHPAAFLPHAASPEEDAALQPIWLTDKIENPNQATLLVLLDTQDTAPFVNMFERVFFLFPYEEAEGVRKTLADRDPLPLYWRQSPEGEWIKAP